MALGFRGRCSDSGVLRILSRWRAAGQGLRATAVGARLGGFVQDVQLRFVLVRGCSKEEPTSPIDTAPEVGRFL
jgi:hypothetical protein